MPPVPFSTAPAEAEADIVPAPLAVYVTTVETVEDLARVHTTGRVEPARQVILVPEVGGRLVSLSDELVPGGRFREGDEIGRIDSREYSMGVRSEETRVTQAELELALETQRGKAASQEWSLVNPEAEASSLALREPHQKAAQQALSGAEVGRDRAKLSLERTQIKAPFNSIVVEESAEVGQVVGMTSSIANLIGTDHFRVRTSVPVEHLQLIEIPGARATVTQQVGSETIEREGTVERLSSQLDPSSQTAQVWVRVADPMDPPEGQLPLLAGSFVSVTIEGTSQTVQAVPRSALYDGKYTWVVDENEQLKKAELEIAWTDAERVYVTEGVETGDRLVTSPMSNPMNGALVEVIE